MQELLNILNDTKSTLDNYYEIHKNEDFSNKRNNTMVKNLVVDILL